MERKRNRDDHGGIDLPQPSSRDLRGRQSVRATFKLTEKAIEAMSAVSVHLGIKQKSLFDHLIDDLAALETIAREMQALPFEQSSRVQKTYVLSRKTLTCLDRAAKSHTASRDALVEYSIQRLMPVIEKEKRRHKNRKKLLKEINDYLIDGEKILNEAEGALGSEDPVMAEFERALARMVKTRNDIAEFIERGSLIENF